MLTRTAKESIKTALAMVIAYGISLSLDWDKSMWAGFAVAMVSLGSIGQSLNKGMLRMAGTLLGAVVGLTLIAGFAQARWPFLAAMAFWVGLCTYMMGGPRHQYFWHVSGFTAANIAFSSVPNAEGAFDLATLRALQTGLGVLVYSLVSIFIWPASE